jgi:hypothetical protein
MKTTFTIVLSLLLASGTLSAQTATNFTCSDCSGVSHDLFSELDAGKVIVLCWVMPCATCIGPALTAHNVVQSYQASFPNRVYFYMADDYANTSCGVLNSWGNSYNIPESNFSRRFSNAAINMLHYGSTGMPKTVVLGGSNHSVFYNINNTIDATALQNAINLALTSTGVPEVGGAFTGISVGPNPSSDQSTLKFTLGKPQNVSVEVYNLQGRRLQTVDYGKLTTGAHELKVETGALASGTYLLRLQAGEEIRFINLVVAKK